MPPFGFISRGEVYYEQLLHAFAWQEKQEEPEGVPEKVSRLAINMDGGFQTDKGVEWEEVCKVVVLPSMASFDITNSDLPMGVNLSIAGIR